MSSIATDPGTAAVARHAAAPGTAAETADAIEGSRKGASQNFLQPEEEEQPTPAVSDIDDDDEQAFMQV